MTEGEGQEGKDRRGRTGGEGQEVGGLVLIGSERDIRHTHYTITQE